MASDTDALQLVIPDRVTEKHVHGLVLLENMLFHGADDLRALLEDPHWQCLVATGCCPRPSVPEPHSISDDPWPEVPELVDTERRVLGGLFGFTAVPRLANSVKPRRRRQKFCDIAEIAVDADAPFPLVAGALLYTLKKRTEGRRWSHLEVNIGEHHAELVPFFVEHGFTCVEMNGNHVRRLVWSVLSDV